MATRAFPLLVAGVLGGLGLLGAGTSLAQRVQIPPVCPEGTKPVSGNQRLGNATVIRYSCRAANGAPRGPWAAVYPNGMVAQTGSYDDNGKLDGDLLYFNPDGVKLARTHFVAGEETGERAAYYPGGGLQSVGPVVGGQPDGLWSFFHDNGRKESEGDMKLGKAQGPWTYWDAAGRVLKNGDWAAGEKVGVWFERATAAEDFKKIEYQGGKPVVAEPPKPKSLEGVACRFIAEGRYVLPVGDIDAVSSNWPEGVLSIARVVPAYRGGEAFGYKVFAIPAGSLLATCGFHDGDVVRAVNDVPTNSLDSFEKAADRVRQRGEAVFHVERDHRIVLLRIEKGPDVGAR